MGGPNYQMTDVDTVASPHGYMGDKTNQSGGAAEQAESHARWLWRWLGRQWSATNP